MHAWDVLRRPIWMFDPVLLRGVYANKAALKLWGAESLEALLQRDFSNLSPAVRARTERLVAATADGREISEGWTFYPNGKPVTVQATISTHVLDDNRSVLLFEAAPVEMEPEERRAVEALRHTSTLITLFDQAGAALFSNPAAFSVYGSEAWPFDRRFVDPAVGQSLFEQTLLGQTTVEVCETLTRNGQRYHRMETRQVVDPVSGASGVLLNETDVTARVMAERSRAAAEQRAAMAEARQAFLTDMSHELRTPLNAVIGFSELLKTSDLSATQASQMEHIHHAGLHLLGVVNEMIGLSEENSRGDPQSPTPATPTEPDPDSAPATPDDADESRPIRVLYVDDNDSNRALVKAVLGAQDIECETADDGRQGVEAAERGGWDIVLMDIQMPVMNGVEAAMAIRRLPDPLGNVPIVAVTANTLDDQLDSYRAAGMDDVVAKPINIAELMTKIAYWIGEAGDGESETQSHVA
jgi:CheY-like chemotaxis protein/PAS domain-containing protein